VVAFSPASGSRRCPPLNARPFWGWVTPVDRDRRAVLEAVVVDRLPEQRDLDHARVGEPLALVDDVVGRAVHLGAARERHDAVGAELVAAPGDADVAPTRRGVGVRIDERERSSISS
jgi:hypothetical protein